MFKIKVNKCFTTHSSNFLFDSDTTSTKNLSWKYQKQGPKGSKWPQGCLLAVGKVLAKSEKPMYSCQVWCMHDLLMTLRKCVRHS